MIKVDTLEQAKKEGRAPWSDIVLISKIWCGTMTDFL